jgi:hypothetical protein
MVKGEISQITHTFYTTLLQYSFHAMTYTRKLADLPTVTNQFLPSMGSSTLLICLNYWMQTRVCALHILLFIKYYNLLHDLKHMTI